MRSPRARALEIAMQCIQAEAERARRNMILAQDSLYRDEAYKHRQVKRYKELVDALQYIENLARQRELL